MHAGIEPCSSASLAANGVSLQFWKNRLQSNHVVLSGTWGCKKRAMEFLQVTIKILVWSSCRYASWWTKMIDRIVFLLNRLENEHLNNAGKFRALKIVPLPFHEVDDQDWVQNYILQCSLINIPTFFPVEMKSTLYKLMIKIVNLLSLFLLHSINLYMHTKSLGLIGLLYVSR